MEGIIRYLSACQDDMQEYWGQELYKNVIQKH